MKHTTTVPASFHNLRPPIFINESGKFVADSCDPVWEAAQAGEIEFHAMAHGHYPGTPLPKGELPHLKSVGYWNADCRQNWGLDWHRNEGVEIVWLERGTLNYEVNENCYQLVPGDILVNRPWEVHRVGTPFVTPGTLVWIIFDQKTRYPHQSWDWPSWIVLSKADLAELSAYLYLRRHSRLRRTSDLFQCWSHIRKILAMSNVLDKTSELAIEINRCLLLILQQFRAQHQMLASDELLLSEPAGMRTVRLFLDELHSFPSQLVRPWTLRGMAKICQIGRTAFSDYCMRHTGLSPMKYLTQCRIELAKRIMRDDPERSVSNIALDCGFGSSQYFSTVFRLITGTSPGEFRKQLLTSETSEEQGPDVALRSNL